GCRVEPQRVVVLRDQPRRHVAGDRIEILPCRLACGLPVAAAPAVPAQPAAGPRLRATKERERFVERRAPVEAHLVLGKRPRREMHVRVREARQYDAPAKVDDLRRRERRLVHSDTAGDPLACDRECALRRNLPVECADEPVLEDHASNPTRARECRLHGLATCAAAAVRGVAPARRTDTARLPPLQRVLLYAGRHHQVDRDRSKDQQEEWLDRVHTKLVPRARSAKHDLRRRMRLDEQVTRNTPCPVDAPRAATHTEDQARNRYPTPRTVTSRSGLAGSRSIFRRRFMTRTSHVRSSPRWLECQRCWTSSRRVKTRSGACASSASSRNSDCVRSTGRPSTVSSSRDRSSSRSPTTSVVCCVER